MSDFVTGKGEEAAHAGNGEWLQIDGASFGHGCCDCGLFHAVNWMMVNDQGEQVIATDPCTDKPLNLAIRWTRDEEETKRLREYQAKTELERFDRERGKG